MSKKRKDIFQLDYFNHATNRYEVVATSRDRASLVAMKDSYDPVAWRIWNRSRRANTDRMLLPVVRLVRVKVGMNDGTLSERRHARRWSRVHEMKADLGKPELVTYYDFKKRDTGGDQSIES